MFESMNEPGSTILAFNSVERLMRGDFFHAVTADAIRSELARFPNGWGVSGLGTTNWYGRHGELLIEGCAANPRFFWADPGADLRAIIRELDGSLLDRRLLSPSLDEEEGKPYFPFAAVAVWDPVRPARVWELGAGQDVHAEIAALCEDANIGLASLRVMGPLRTVEFQTMCDIPLGGVQDDRQAVATVERQEGGSWDALGFYSANPTVRSVLAHSSAAVHLHGMVDSRRRGGHINGAIAGAHAAVEVRVVHDLVLRISGLDVAQLPVRAIA